MKRLFALVFLCGFLITNAYGEIINYTDGSKYVGEVRNGKRHGQGVYTHATGEKYVGEWKDDERNGAGTEFFPDGAKYVGEWKDGKKHGQGLGTNKDLKHIGGVQRGDTAR